MLRKRLRVLMNFAIRAGDMDRNPVLATKPYRAASGGFHSWAENEIARHERLHPMGSNAPLTLNLMLWTQATCFLLTLKCGSPKKTPRLPTDAQG